jgi:hypothetical protein
MAKYIERRSAAEIKKNMPPVERARRRVNSKELIPSLSKERVEICIEKSVPITTRSLKKKVPKSTRKVE